MRWSNNDEQDASNDYFCDYGVFLTETVGPNCVLVPAGEDPLGRYSLTRDFYMMTTELTNAMYMELMETVVEYGCDSDSDDCAEFADRAYCNDNPSVQVCEGLSWYDAAHLANLLSEAEGLEQCYNTNINDEQHAE